MIKTFYPILVWLMCCSNFLYAQKAPAWGGGADVTDLSFGFSFTYISSYFKINKQPDWQLPYTDPETGGISTGNIASISSPSEPGFAVGFLTRYRLAEHLEVRTTPSLVFANRKLVYTYRDGPVLPNKEKQVSTTAFDIPLQLKLKSDRIGDLRAYLIGGAKMTAFIGKNDDKNKSPVDKDVKLRRYFASYEAGIGFDIYFEFFKLSPEIKICNSFGNILHAEDTPYSRPLSGLALHTVQFSLYFE